MTIRTTHPNGTTYEYLPEFTSINWMGKKVVHRLRREPAVLVTYTDGTTRFIWNSFYD